jgi:magnesium transporter
MKSSFELKNGAIAETTNEQASIVVYVAPDDNEKHYIIETFRLDSYDLDSALDADEVPRFEVSPERVTLIWNRAMSATAQEQVRLDVSSLGMFLAQGRLLIVLSEGPIPFSAKEFAGVVTPVDVLLRFLLHTVRHYVGHLKIIKQMSASLGSKINTSMENRYLLQMFTLSESLIYYLNAIEANGVVLTKLRGLAERLPLTKEQIDLLDDVILENHQCVRQAQIYSTVLSGLMDARGTIVNNNMNVLLKNLTLINIIFLPLNLIASIGGMSEFSMMTQGIDWRVSYAMFSLGMLVFGWATWIVVVRAIEKSRTRNENGS